MAADRTPTALKISLLYILHAYQTPHDLRAIEIIAQAARAEIRRAPATVSARYENLADLYLEVCTAVNVTESLHQRCCNAIYYHWVNRRIILSRFDVEPVLELINNWSATFIYQRDWVFNTLARICGVNPAYFNAGVPCTDGFCVTFLQFKRITFEMVATPLEGVMGYRVTIADL